MNRKEARKHVNALIDDVVRLHAGDVMNNDSLMYEVDGRVVQEERDLLWLDHLRSLCGNRLRLDRRVAGPRKNGVTLYYRRDAAQIAQMTIGDGLTIAKRERDAGEARVANADVLATVTKLALSRGGQEPDIIGDFIPTLELEGLLWDNRQDDEEANG